MGNKLISNFLHDSWRSLAKYQCGDNFIPNKVKVKISPPLAKLKLLEWSLDFESISSQ